MKTVVITGVTGQMGSYLADEYINRGYNVVGAVRRLSVPNNKNISHLLSHRLFKTDIMDLGDAHSINKFVDKYKPDYFFNCAANSFVGTSWDCPEQHFEFNTLGVLRQLEAIKTFSPNTRYLNFGSSEEFGNVQYSPQDEKHPPCSRSPYGASKVAARQIIKVYRESYNLFAVQCWCFNYESPRRGIEFISKKVTSSLAKIKYCIERGIDFTPLELGNLNARRDWSHAKDFAKGVIKMIENDIPKEYVFSSNETHTVRSLVDECLKIYEINGQWVGCDKDEKFIDDSGRVVVKVNPKFFRPAEVDLLIGDSSLARRELNWKPEYSFNELIQEMALEDVKNTQ